MPGFATLRLTWEPRMLSILRIIVGLLYMEHGLAKVLGFPLQPNHAPYAPFTLNPGLQGMLELVGGLLLALGLFTRTVAFILAGNMAVAYFMAHAPRDFFPLLNGGELAIVYCFVFLYLWVAGAENGASIDYARLHPPYRRAGPERGARQPGPPSICRRGWATLRGQPVTGSSVR
jgi:putative oxidoreductase